MRDIDEMDEFSLNSGYLSECCSASIYGEVIDGIGICSQCKEWAGVIKDPESEE